MCLVSTQQKTQRGGYLAPTEVRRPEPSLPSALHSVVSIGRSCPRACPTRTLTQHRAYVRTVIMRGRAVALHAVHVQASDTHKQTTSPRVHRAPFCGHVTSVAHLHLATCTCFHVQCTPGDVGPTVPRLQYMYSTTTILTATAARRALPSLCSEEHHPTDSNFATKVERISTQRRIAPAPLALSSSGGHWTCRAARAPPPHKLPGTTGAARRRRTGGRLGRHGVWRCRQAVESETFVFQRLGKGCSFASQMCLGE